MEFIFDKRECSIRALADTYSQQGRTELIDEQWITPFEDISILVLHMLFVCFLIVVLLKRVLIKVDDWKAAKYRFNNRKLLLINQNNRNIITPDVD